MGGLARPEVIALSLFVEITSKEFSEELELRVSGDLVSVKSKMGKTVLKTERKSLDDHLLQLMFALSLVLNSFCQLWVLRAETVRLSS